MILKKVSYLLNAPKLLVLAYINMQIPKSFENRPIFLFYSTDSVYLTDSLTDRPKKVNFKILLYFLFSSNWLHQKAS